LSVRMERLNDSCSFSVIKVMCLDGLVLLLP
jgi:hypothetical protein